MWQEAVLFLTLAALLEVAYPAGCGHVSTRFILHLLFLRWKSAMLLLFRAEGTINSSSAQSGAHAVTHYVLVSISL